ncbi:MAG: hypothetical protein COB91_03675 [Nitrosopumilales archaeon]|jgi:hypothetical protein|uniref:Uncharacterized protein n=1 Tax=Marine Group I thaumarchaeote TaxID=2511932 RepID=A0A7K4MD60_9ARCH|nr:hypothetical protein [Marine Group I thaumarchaeote]NWK02658.1 hypothetical protein [Marine Group I thaumarchaeote]PBO83455.1 MAG: hypothetical protein COB91_03675 [Nitrosopumilales archaeon]
MSNWLATDDSNSIFVRHSNFVIFCIAAVSALTLFVVFQPIIESVTTETPMIVHIMFIPTFIVGFLYGLKITERVMKPSDSRSPIKRGIVKMFLFFFVIGGLFSSINFALNGGSMLPDGSIFDAGIIESITQLITYNGGVTFMIVSSIVLMAAATRKIVGLGSGYLGKIISFVGTFVFFSMVSVSLTQTDPTHSQVFLYTFFYAGIISGAFYEMNKLTTKQNMWDDYSNGYL